jgi:hypothetical protein
MSDSGAERRGVLRAGAALAAAWGAGVFAPRARAQASKSVEHPKWQLTGDYFENCTCNVVCPCLFSPKPPLTSNPTQGFCGVAFLIHIDRGRYDDVALDGLNTAVVAYAAGPMGTNKWKVASYLDTRADERQKAALAAILSGKAGGPMAAFTSLIGENLGSKSVPITYRIDGKKRSAEIPNVLHMSVRPLPSLAPDQEIWATTGHPFNPDKLALAVGEEGSTFSDYGWKWDNSGRNGHYAPINWSA